MIHLLAFSVLLHTALPYVICYLLGMPLWMNLFQGAFGAWPDVSRFFQKNPKDWNVFYRKTHEWHWWYIFFFGWVLHVVMDFYAHTEEKYAYYDKWYGSFVPAYYKWWVVPLELVLWAIIFMIFL